MITYKYMIEALLLTLPENEVDTAMSAIASELSAEGEIEEIAAIVDAARECKMTTLADDLTTQLL